MNAEKYVDDILKGVKCTGAKKKEIRSQLLSDIAVRRQQGEALEEIMESMGSAQEIAEAFCQNLSETDRKAYRRRKAGIIIAAVILAFLLLAWYIWWVLPKPAVPGGEFTQEAVAARVENMITLLDQDDFAALQENSIDEVRPLLTQDTIDEVRKGISDNWGGRLSLGTVYVQGVKQKGKLIIVTQTDVIYENISVVYTISFDENLKLAGLYMR